MKIFDGQYLTARQNCRTNDGFKKETANTSGTIYPAKCTQSFAYEVSLIAIILRSSLQREWLCQIDLATKFDLI